MELAGEAAQDVGGADLSALEQEPAPCDGRGIVGLQDWAGCDELVRNA